MYYRRDWMFHSTSPVSIGYAIIFKWLNEINHNSCCGHSVPFIISSLTGCFFKCKYVSVFVFFPLKHGERRWKKVKSTFPIGYFDELSPIQIKLLSVWSLNCDEFACLLIKHISTLCSSKQESASVQVFINIMVNESAESGTSLLIFVLYFRHRIHICVHKIRPERNAVGCQFWFATFTSTLIFFFSYSR